MIAETEKTSYSTVVDRRKTKRVANSIEQILEQMQKIADDEFGGDLQANALTIFVQLSTPDKKTFLKKSLMLHWENVINEEIGDIEIEDVQISPEGIILERENIADLNRLEQIKLKNWLTRAAFVIGVIFFLAMGVLLYMSDPNTKQTVSLFQQFTDVFKLLFNMD